jgi:hypothetical protein
MIGHYDSPVPPGQINRLALIGWQAPRVLASYYCSEFSELH